MSWLTLLITSLTVICLGYLIAKFWVEILLFFVVLRAILAVTIVSGASTIFWVVFIEGETDGWQQIWIFFFTLYSVILGIILVIIFDIYDAGIKLVRDIFRIK